MAVLHHSDRQLQLLAAYPDPHRAMGISPSACKSALLYFHGPRNHLHKLLLIGVNWGLKGGIIILCEARWIGQG